MSKRSSSFAITIQNVLWNKSVFGDWLRIDDFSCMVCVAEEKYNPPLDADTGDAVGEGGRHHHAYIQTSEKWLLTEIRERLEVFTGGENGLDIQTCRSPKSWLLYITKSDYHPYLYNVRVSQLSLFARCWYHAKTTYRYPRAVSKTDDFIVSCGQYARFAIGICEEHVQNLRVKIANDRPLYLPNLKCSLVNDILLALERYDHCYIYGLPGLGKTEIVDWYLRGRNYWKCGEPNNFTFGTLPDCVQYIWFEDFRPEKYDSLLSTILSLMDHKEVTISRKGVDDTTKIIKAKFIFTSNFYIDQYPMLQRRVNFLDVDHRTYECDGCNEDINIFAGVTDSPNFYTPPRTTTENFFHLNSDDLFNDLENYMMNTGFISENIDFSDHSFLS